MACSPRLLRCSAAAKPKADARRRPTRISRSTLRRPDAR
jgi:hypothetical protein